MRYMKLFFLVTDIGFILYWLSAGFSLIPESWAFKHHDHPFMIAWNWSFSAGYPDFCHRVVQLVPTAGESS